VPQLFPGPTTQWSGTRVELRDAGDHQLRARTEYRRHYGQ
jgi:hypothetical protein